VQIRSHLRHIASRSQHEELNLRRMLHPEGLNLRRTQHVLEHDDTRLRCIPRTSRNLYVYWDCTSLNNFTLNEQKTRLILFAGRQEKKGWAEEVSRIGGGGDLTLKFIRKRRIEQMQR